MKTGKSPAVNKKMTMDQGHFVGRTAVITGENNCIGSGTARLKSYHGEHGRSYRHPESWIESCDQASIALPQGQYPKSIVLDFAKIPKRKESGSFEVPGLFSFVSTQIVLYGDSMNRCVFSALSFIMVSAA